MVFQEISHMVHPISPLTHFGFGIGVWTRRVQSMQVALLMGTHCSPLWGHPTCPQTCIDGYFPNIEDLSCLPF